jgi:hypothetical protein
MIIHFQCHYHPYTGELYFAMVDFKRSDGHNQIGDSAMDANFIAQADIIVKVQDSDAQAGKIMCDRANTLFLRLLLLI